jgi:enamine deaminase RidA (YjgF/YER057c/UK114 family)
MDRVNAYRIKTQPKQWEGYCVTGGFVVGNLVFTSGRAAIDSDGNSVGIGDFDAQAEHVFLTLQSILEAAGSGLDKVIKVVIFVTDIKFFPRIVELRKKYFSRPYPADSLVQINALARPELLIEIEAIGLIGGDLVD